MKGEDVGETSKPSPVIRAARVRLRTRFRTRSFGAARVIFPRNVRRRTFTLILRQRVINEHDRGSRTEYGNPGSEAACHR